MICIPMQSACTHCGGTFHPQRDCDNCGESVCDSLACVVYLPDGAVCVRCYDRFCRAPGDVFDIVDSDSDTAENVRNVLEELDALHAERSALNELGLRDVFAQMP